jgi:hypothetical protein
MVNRKLYKTSNQPFFVNTEAAFVILFCRENDDIKKSKLLSSLKCHFFDFSEYNPFDVIRIPMYRFPLLYIQSETGKVLCANTTYYFN